MPVTDTYEVKLQGTFLGQAIEANFHYLQTVGTDNADNLANAFENLVLPAILSISSASVNYTRLAVKNLDSATDFHERTLSSVGSRGGENMQSFGTWSFTYLTNRSDSKSGGKRFAGCVETDQANGVALTQQLIRLGVATLSLGISIQDAASQWRPVIWGKRKGQLGKFANVLSGVNYFGMSTMRSRIFYK